MDTTYDLQDKTLFSISCVTIIVPKSDFHPCKWSSESGNVLHASYGYSGLLSETSKTKGIPLQITTCHSDMEWRLRRTSLGRVAMQRTQYSVSLTATFNAQLCEVRGVALCARYQTVNFHLYLMYNAISLTSFLICNYIDNIMKFFPCKQLFLLLVITNKVWECRHCWLADYLYMSTSSWCCTPIVNVT